MKHNSLSRRLFLSSALWTLLVLPFAAAVLISLYRDAVERSFDARLNQYLEYLIAITSPDQGIDIMEPGNLGEPLFSLPSSGWYWEIRSLGGGTPIAYKSTSLASDVLKLPSQAGVTPDATEIRKAYLPGPDKQLLRVLEREITITQKDQQRRYTYAVAGDAAEIEDEVDAFGTMLAVAFCILGAGLLIATFFQVKFGLRPLHDIGEHLSAIRSGKASRLEGNLPEEIKPLQEELNALIQSNQAIIERARTHVGNLAHALKTPLSVITNEARERNTDEFAKKVADQAEIMREHITHHLGRAQIAARVSIVGGVTDVNETLNSLTNALSRIYSERNLRFVVDCPSEAKFRGEKQDLQEMVGNLLDNACKWAESAVNVSVETEKGQRAATKQLIVLVDDDGPGLGSSELETVIKRGKRMDESKPGSGLGLSIVADLSEMYYGSFVLQRAPTGGVRARLVLPAA